MEARREDYEMPAARDIAQLKARSAKKTIENVLAANSKIEDGVVYLAEVVVLRRGETNEGHATAVRFDVFIPEPGGAPLWKKHGRTIRGRLAYTALYEFAGPIYLMDRESGRCLDFKSVEDDRCTMALINRLKSRYF